MPSFVRFAAACGPVMLWGFAVLMISEEAKEAARQEGRNWTVIVLAVWCLVCGAAVASATWR